MYKSVKVRLSNGKTRRAELTSQARKGYRSARVSVDGVRVRGKVSAKSGFNEGKTLSFKVNPLDRYFI